MADLSDLTDWVFDLDNTLYPATSSLFPQIDVRMRRFIADRLALSLDDAHHLQKRYYREYGTTLRGLMLVNGFDPADFLSYVHDIDHSVLIPDPRLDKALSRLPGAKWIFTNGSHRHAQRVLNQLGIARHFSGIFDIVAADFVPKPQQPCYRAMLDRFGLQAGRSAMVEDLERNLKPAFDLGMTTVWFRQEQHPDHGVVGLPDGALPHVHHVTDDLGAWLDALTAAPDRVSCPSN